jgi:signal transduction histidine kinase
MLGTKSQRSTSKHTPLEPGVAEMVRREERARIARELHDGVSQTLYAIILAATRARSLCEQNRDNEVQHVIDRLLQLANAGQSELRESLATMQSHHVATGGLQSSLAILANEIRTRGASEIRVSIPEEPDLPSGAKEALVMITREALNNVVRHADASHVDVMLDVDADEIVLLVADDGRGFDPDAFRPGHFGLVSMRERAQAHGGTLEVASAEGFGTQVRIRMFRGSGQ